MTMRERLRAFVLLGLACFVSGCSTGLGASDFEKRLVLYVCSGASSGLQYGEPLLRNGASGEVSQFDQFHDASGIFTFEEGSPSSPRQSVPSECVRKLASFAPYSPLRDSYVPLEESRVDVEAMGAPQIPFTRENPAMYVTMRKDGTFELGIHSEFKVDDSPHPNHGKTVGKLFSSGDIVLGRGQRPDLDDMVTFYFVARRRTGGEYTILGAREMSAR